jgi:hypothetical protein
VLLAISVVVTGACTAPDDDAPGATADGLLALVADADGTALVGWSGSDPDPVDVDLPAGETTWISVGRANVLAATLASGDLATSDPLHLGDPLDWRIVNATDPTGQTPGDAVFFATWDPTGGLVAELAGDLASGDGVNVVLVDPSVETAFRIAIDRAVVAAPPAWVAADRLVIVTGDPAAPGSTIVDTSNGELSDGPSGARFIATSVDLSRVATMAGVGQPIVIRDLAGWLAGDGSTVGTVEPPDGVQTAASFALDATGQRLAIAWIMDNGTIQLAVHDGRKGWRRTAEPDLAPARGAAVAWSR